MGVFTSTQIFGIRSGSATVQARVVAITRTTASRTTVAMVTQCNTSYTFHNLGNAAITQKTDNYQTGRLQRPLAAYKCKFCNRQTFQIPEHDKSRLHAHLKP